MIVPESLGVWSSDNSVTLFIDRDNEVCYLCWDAKSYPAVSKSILAERVKCLRDVPGGDKEWREGIMGLFKERLNLEEGCVCASSGAESML